MKLGFMTNILAQNGMKSLTEISDWALENGFEDMEVGPLVPLDEGEFGRALDKGISITALAYCRNYLSTDEEEAALHLAEPNKRILFASGMGIEKVVTSLSLIHILLKRAEAFAGHFPGCTAYQSVEEMLLKEDVDVIHVLTPHFLHKEHVIRSLNAGNHVLTEKPIAIYTEDARELIRTAKENHRQFGVIFQNRYIPGIREARRMVEAGELVHPIGAFSNLNWFRPASYYECDWKGRWETEGGGVVIDQAIHSIDTVSYTHLDVYKRQEFCQTAALLSQQPLRHIKHMASQIPDNAGAGESLLHSPLAEHARIGHSVGTHYLTPPEDLPQRALLNQLLHVAESRNIPVAESNHAHLSAQLRIVERFLAVLLPEGKRLFTQNVLFSLQRCHRQIYMGDIGRADADRVHLVQQLLIALAHRRPIQRLPFDKLLPSLRRHIVHRRNPGPRYQLPGCLLYISICV